MDDFNEEGPRKDNLFKKYLGAVGGEPDNDAAFEYSN